MEGKTISINCRQCGKKLIILPMNSRFELLEEIYCRDCKED